MKRVIVLLSVCLSVAAVAQNTPRLMNAKVETSSASSGLEKTVRSLRIVGSPSGAEFTFPVPAERE